MWYFEQTCSTHTIAQAFRVPHDGRHPYPAPRCHRQRTLYPTTLVQNAHTDHLPADHPNVRHNQLHPNPPPLRQHPGSTQPSTTLRSRPSTRNRPSSTSHQRQHHNHPTRRHHPNPHHQPTHNPRHQRTPPSNPSPTPPPRDLQRFPSRASAGYRGPGTADGDSD